MDKNKQVTLKHQELSHTKNTASAKVIIQGFLTASLCSPEKLYGKGANRGAGRPNMAATDSPGGPPMAGDHPQHDSPRKLIGPSLLRPTTLFPPPNDAAKHLRYNIVSGQI